MILGIGYQTLFVQVFETVDICRFEDKDLLYLLLQDNKEELDLRTRAAHPIWFHRN